MIKRDVKECQIELKNAEALSINQRETEKCGVSVYPGVEELLQLDMAS